MMVANAVAGNEFNNNPKIFPHLRFLKNLRMSDVAHNKKVTSYVYKK